MAPDAPRLTEETGSFEEFGALLEAAVDAIVVSDIEGRIIAFNRAAEQLFGYPSDEVLGKPLELLMPEPYHSEHHAYIDRYLQTGEPRIIGVGRAVEARKRDGRVFPIWLSVGDAAGSRTRSFVGIIRDLSAERAAERERLALEARLQDVGRFSLMGEMAAGIAHEINQPLAAIATYSHAAKRILAQPELDRDSLTEACEKIGEQARRAGQVIENLRSLLRKQEIRQTSLNLNEVLADVVHFAHGSAASSDIPLTVEYAERSVPVRGNAVQLQQVILNLVRNAVDAMSVQSAKREGIGIVVSIERDKARLLVSDRGAGIPDRLAKDIFEPFVSTKSEGLGVGLAISRTIVEAHDGSLTHETRPGGGTIFHLTLPLENVGVP